MKTAIKALKVIAIIILLLVSTFYGLMLLVAVESNDTYEGRVFIALAIVLASVGSIAFLNQRCFRAYVVLASAVFALWQIGCRNWNPTLASLVTLLPLMVMKPRTSSRLLLIPVLSLAVLVIDAFVFRHRIAVTAHSLHSLDGDLDPKILHSPSGKTTAYVMTGGFTDTYHYVCISGKHLMPISHLIDSSDLRGPRSSGIIAKWDGPIFLAGDKLVSFAYDERSGQFIDRSSYCHGGVRINDEEFMRHIKSHEAFAEYLLSLPPKN